MAKDTCFVIMPFRAELHYMYLYIKQHLEQRYGMEVGRGDSKVMTVTLLEKIRRYIEDADIIIADCSGRNPNVFYELGMAHILDKPVVLITSDPPELQPTDIKAYEVITYSLDHETFITKLDSVVQGLVNQGFDELYDSVVTLLSDFFGETGLAGSIATRENFVRIAASRARGRALPKPDNKAEVAAYLPDAISPPVDIELMSRLKTWIGDIRP